MKGSRFPSAVLLVVANLVPVAGVLFWDWSAFFILLLFWVEAGIVGATTFLRMLFWAPGHALKLILAPFLLIPWMLLFLGTFVLLYYFMGALVLLFLPPELAAAYEPYFAAARVEKGSDLLPHEVMAIVLGHSDPIMLASIVMLAASHLYSFGYNYLYRGECQRTGLLTLLLLPFTRLWLASIPIGAAVFALTRGGLAEASVWLLLVCIALKTGADLVAHLREHRDRAQVDAQSAGKGKGWLYAGVAGFVLLMVVPGVMPFLFDAPPAPTTDQWQSDIPASAIDLVNAGRKARYREPEKPADFAAEARILKQALEIRPDYYTANRDLAYALLYSGDQQGFAEYARKALELAEKNGIRDFWYYRWYAERLAFSGNTAEARDVLQRGLKLDPGNSQLRSTLNALDKRKPGSK